MGDEGPMLLDIAAALTLALAFGWIATRLRLSSIVGYVLAGVALSPFTPGPSTDVEGLAVIADVGVILLLFGIGVQFRISELARVGAPVVAMTVAQVAIVGSAVYLVADTAGWSSDEALYAAAAVAISSGVVLVKLLEDRGDINARHGHVAVAWSLVQDLIAVIFVLASSTGAGEDENAVREAAIAGAKAVGFVAVALVVGLRVVPWVLSRVAEERSRELFFLAIAALVIGTALASEQAGLSLALGAFIAGIVVSESDLSHRVLGELLPTRDVFAVLFFTSAGTLIDPELILEQWHAVALLGGSIVLLKPVVSWGLLRLRETPQSSLLAAAALLPAGEFSFLLARSGLEGEAISEDVFGVILAATVASVVLAPAALGLSYARAQAGPVMAPVATAPTGAPSRLGRHAVVAGYDRAGRIVAGVLAARFEVIVVTEDRAAAKAARDAGLSVVEGSPVSPAIIERMRLEDARLLSITLDDVFVTRRLSELARSVNPHLDISARAALASDAVRFERSGVTRTVIAENEVAFDLARHALQRFGIDSREALAIVQRLRGSV
jgi:CPA2 family monovalent cation:H+ antiporter-2